MEGPGLALNINLFVLLLIACYTDTQERKIKNELIVAILLSGLLLRGLLAYSMTNWLIFLEGLLSLIALFIIGLFLYKLNAWGGGDLKLLSVIGLYIGYSWFFYLIILSILIIPYAWLFRHYNKRKKYIPMAPIMTLAFFVLTIYKLYL